MYLGLLKFYNNKTSVSKSEISYKIFTLIFFHSASSIRGLSTSSSENLTINQRLRFAIFTSIRLENQREIERE